MIVFRFGREAKDSPQENRITDQTRNAPGCLLFDTTSFMFRTTSLRPYDCGWRADESSHVRHAHALGLVSAGAPEWKSFLSWA
mmetsp:Transcript_13781/g.31428  ORF Transcript_13781/g.31428 Transcript_13781/m.31428 type:complete len:83 (-) Transcript_13781:548-796(-)